MSRITLQSMPQLRQRSIQPTQTRLITSRPKPIRATRRPRIHYLNLHSQSGHTRFRKPTKQLMQSQYREQIGRTSCSGYPDCATFGRLIGRKLPGIGTPRSQTHVKINPQTRRQSALPDFESTRHPLLKSRPGPEENTKLGKSIDSPLAQPAK